MNKEIKQKWIEALRSGKYKQGQYVLRSADDKFCCLGVLCDIVTPQSWDGIINRPANHIPHLYKILGYETTLPTEVRSQAEIEDSYTINTLIRMNDQGESFEAIAAFIEENL